MQTKTKYEEIALKELRALPGEALPQVIKILRSLRESILVVKTAKKDRGGASGLCGIWKDVRSADEIIEDIHVHRTGFGGRQIEL